MSAIDTVQAALMALAEGASRADLAGRAGRISDDYRQFRPSAGVIGSRADALAYALARMPATLAAAETVLLEAARRAPGFAPKTVLDAGAGPGTASWAASAVWDGLEAVLFDHNPHLLGLAADLSAAGAGGGLVVKAERGDLTGTALPSGRFDLVLASYALTELPDTALEGLADALWSRCEGLLVLIEPGRPRDYERLLRIRARLLGQGAEMVAPCPHAHACPIAAPDWCHFSVRLARTKAHMQIKGATLSYEDEKLSYLVLARPGVGAAPVAARVLAPVEVSKFDARLKLCTPGGLEQGAVMKRDKAAYRQVHKLSWGDGLDITPVLR